MGHITKTKYKNRTQIKRVIEKFKYGMLEIDDLRQLLKDVNRLEDTLKHRTLRVLELEYRLRQKQEHAKPRWERCQKLGCGKIVDASNGKYCSPEHAPFWTSL